VDVSLAEEVIENTAGTRHDDKSRQL